VSVRNIRILLVDDVRVFRDLEQTFLQRCSYEVSSAASGAEALEKALRLRPHLILLDCNMPGMDGFECCRRIKSDPVLKGTKVIMVTTQGGDGDRERCLQAGCDDFLAKPINRRTFLSCIERTLAIPVRVAERLPLAAKVLYSPGDEPAKPAVTANVSVGGAFVFAETPPPAGTPLRLHMELPGIEMPIEADAEVVWNTAAVPPAAAPGFGLKFTRIDLDAVGLIERYVAARV